MLTAGVEVRRAYIEESALCVRPTSSFEIGLRPAGPAETYVGITRTVACSMLSLHRHSITIQQQGMMPLIILLSVTAVNIQFSSPQGLLRSFGFPGSMSMSSGVMFRKNVPDLVTNQRSAIRIGVVKQDVKTSATPRPEPMGRTSLAEPACVRKGQVIEGNNRSTDRPREE